jgi:hypothetical protein
LLEHWREQWARAVNLALADADSAERIDHRTLKAQGVTAARQEESLFERKRLWF